MKDGVTLKLILMLKNNQLVYDLSSKLTIKFIRSRKVEGLENFFITLQVFKMNLFRSQK